jgi:undecaprenyl-diphosphatase
VDEWLKTIFLGFVEGVTEFLPISSTGHLLIASQLVHFQESMGGTFEVFIQFGAVLAVIAFYAADLLGQARELASSPQTRRFWLAILIAFLPAAVAGLLLRDFIKNFLFASPTIIAVALIVGGVILIGVERLPRPKLTERATNVSLGQALMIGLAQVVSLVPGVSRSGATIVGGLLVGLDRPAATAFSFYLAIPTLGAATLYDLARSYKDLTRSDLGYLFVGTLVAGIVAWLAIGWLLRYVAHHSFVAFGVYRIVAGVVVLGLVAAHVLPS